MSDNTEDTTVYGIPLDRLVGANGRRKTQSLFLEHNYHKEKTDPSVYTLKDRDHRDKISLKRLYMDCEDPTEYLFAQAAFGSWEHWQILKSAPFFQPYALAWAEELEIKLRSEALLTVKRDALDNPTSAKWLAEKGWEKPERTQRGRPSKKELEREKKQRQQVHQALEEDASRLFGSSEEDAKGE